MGDRDGFKRLIIEASYPDRKDCEHCAGQGQVEANTRSIHTRRGSFGASWRLHEALRAVDEAIEIGWLPDFTGYDLMVKEADGKVVRFDIKKPRDLEAEALRVAKCVERFAEAGLTQDRLEKITRMPITEWTDFTVTQLGRTYWELVIGLPGGVR